jgi:hypothetical protein
MIVIQRPDRLQFDDDRLLYQQIDRVGPGSNAIVFNCDTVLLCHG